MSPNPELLALLPREVRVLLLTAGGAKNDAAIRKLLEDGLAWDELLVVLEWERAVPVAWWRLKQLGASADTPGGAAMERLSRVMEFRAMTLEDRLRRVLKGFREADIPVILLKGAGLAVSAYSSFAERPMGDIDLLVSPHHARRAWDLALAQGWVWDEFVYPEGHYQAHHHLPPLFDGARTGARLELHTALSLASHPFALSFEEAQAVSRPAGRIDDGRTRCLDPEHALIHMAVHFAWAHLASFGIWRLARDLSALSSQGIDWDRALEVARRYRAGPALFWSLRMASSLSGVDVAPDGLVRELRPSQPAWLMRTLERHLAMHVVSRITPCPSEKLRRLMWSLALSPRRTASSAALPWENEPSRRSPSHLGEMSAMNRIRSQLAHARDWRNYLRAVGGRGVLAGAES